VSALALALELEPGLALEPELVLDSQ